MSDFREQFRSAGVLPSGPVSPWPKDRKIVEQKHYVTVEGPDGTSTVHDTEVKVGFGKMAKGLGRSVSAAFKNGRVSEEVRNERYDICQRCPHFIEDKKRCSQCGCFMAAKTWLGGPKELLCPKDKWVR